MKRILAAVALFVIASSGVGAQQAPRESVSDVKTTTAYSMLIIRKVALKTELEKILAEYTSDHPSAKSKRFELDVLNNELGKLAETAESNLAKLTTGYGTLILQKVRLVCERQALLLEYAADHLKVKLNEVELNLLEHEIIKLMR